MGAGILPAAIHNNKLYLLFGKENKYEDSAPGYSDFGGGTDNTETFLKTAVREAEEELTGFLGNKEVITNLLKKGTYNIDLLSEKYSTYRCHIVKYNYDPMLPFYYNNNNRFLQKKIPNIIKRSKIFEKQHIKWVCVEDLPKLRNTFRHFFRDVIDEIYSKRVAIKSFVKNQKFNKKKTKKNRLNKNKTKKNKY